jgi:hypothetical protein
LATPGISSSKTVVPSGTAPSASLLSGGRVFAVRAPDVPGGGPVAAILRYAL